MCVSLYYKSFKHPDYLCIDFTHGVGHDHPVGGGCVGVGVEVGAGPGGGGVVGNKLVPQKVVDLTSVKGGHTKCFSKKVSPYQCKFNVARVKQSILVFQNVGWKKYSDLRQQIIFMLTLNFFKHNLTVPPPPHKWRRACFCPSQAVFEAQRGTRAYRWI